jgi:hypothetical protein
MWFDSLDTVKAFMGDDYDVAHVPAETQAVLADFDKRSAHHQVLAAATSPGNQQRHLTSRLAAHRHLHPRHRHKPST